MKQDNKSKDLLKRIMREYLKPFLPQVFISILLMLVSGLMTAMTASIMEKITNDVLIDRDINMLRFISLAMIGVFFFKGVATYGHNTIMNRVGQRIVANIQKQLYSHIIREDMSFFDTNNTGNLVANMVADANTMRSAVADSITKLAKSSLTLVFLVGLMLYKDWKLSLLTFFVFPIAGVTIAWIGKRIRKISKQNLAQQGVFASFLTETFQGIRQVKSYCMEKHEESKAKEIINMLFKYANKSFKISKLTTPVNELLSGGAGAVLIFYGGYRIIQEYGQVGALTPGELTSILTAFGLAYEPIKKLSNVNSSIQTGLGAAERVFAIIDNKPKIKNKKGAKDLLISKSPEIEFNNVEFSYDGVDDKAIDGVSLKVPEGKTVAFVGGSGSGKSTLLNLVPRFYDLQEGSIKIAGKDVRDVKLKSLRENIALVSQDVCIFNDTVRNNIAYAKPSASEEEIIAAAKAAYAHDFITNDLLDGYDTVLGESGSNLSGGQKQRISIARALLKNAPILLLDEATSALDTESEREVQKAIDSLATNRTTLVVAHRLSTIVNSDVIYVLKDGKIVEKGSHNELIKHKGIYEGLYLLQK
ncbi:MAG: ABC transporter ATP-binding protein/permease [Alphaproteobacteria bacterium]|jgi:subfamily B ATP-binding cassette protein MsbA|nr:ABC transporter ATP-binding protein/permease [Alphaproteobacteria bacterium]